MEKFITSDGQFYLNDQPYFVHAAEFHYFRTPKDQWRSRLELLKESGFNTLAMYIPWIWHQLEEGVSDFDGHSNPMRDLAGFLDLAAEMGFYLIPRPGPYIMAETINEGIPPWVFQNHPQAAFIDQHDQPINVVSYLHPDFLACVEQWYQAVFAVLTPRQITRGGKIIMIQLDNEMGMMQWVRNIFDVNADTLARLEAYLQDRYGEQLRERYPSDQFVDFLREGILNPDQAYAEKIVTDYKLFYRGYLHDYAAYLLKTAQTCGLEVLPVINIHGFGNGGKTFPIGLSQLIHVIRMDGMISATDVYPLTIFEGSYHELVLVNEMTKAVQNKNQALFSIEFQSGGNHDFGKGQSSMYDLHSRLCISTGMRAINHYLFFAGVNDPVLSPVKRHDWGPPVRNDGSLRRHYPRYGKLSRVLNAYGTDLVRSQPQTVTSIGFILDYYLTEVNNPFTKEATRLITFQRDEILFDMLAKGLAATHRPFNALDLSTASLNATETPLLWVMIEKQCSAEIQQKLVDYVRMGGKLVLAGRMCIEDFENKPCTILKDALGIAEINDAVIFIPRDIQVFNHQDVPVSVLETYTGAFEEVIATDEDGKTVGFTNTVGQGKVLMFGATLPAHTLEDIDIVHQMAMRMGCVPLFQLSSWADVRLSRGEKGSFLFINNYQDDPVETMIACDKKDLFGGSMVRVPARRGLILPVDWQLRDGVLIHSVTAEITEVAGDGETLTLKTDPPEFEAELSLTGYECYRSTTIAESGETKRVKVQGNEGLIALRKTGG